MARALLRLAVIVTSVLSSTVSAQSFQYAQRFPQNKLYSLSPPSIGLGDVDGTIAAFGDFNGDKYTDVFVLSSDQTTLSVYSWHHQNFTFIPPSSGQHLVEHNFVITNVVPGDFNYDGRLDVLLMGQKDPVRSSEGEIMMHLYTGTANNTFDPAYISIPSAKGSLPMVLDIDGDMKLDLLGYSWNGDGELSIWKNIAGSSDNQSSIYNVTSAADLLPQTDTNKCTWANPHSNAVVDLNGDCLGDLVFVCQNSNSGQSSLQIWTNEREAGFNLTREAVLPHGAGPLSFADMDGDGSADIIFPVHDGARQQIHVVYNQQMGLCSKSQETNGDDPTCRKAQNLCVADPTFDFDFSHPNSQNYVVFELDEYLSPGETILLSDTTFKGQWPTAVHPGDYNLDGYPDLLVTTNKRVLLLESTLCTFQLCSAGGTNTSKRTFSVVSKGTEDLTRIANPTQAAFFDIDEDGSLDILVLGAKGSGASRTPHFVINNFFNDAFFLKGLVLNGVCGNNCPAEAGLTQKPYGVSYAGATLKFTVLDTSGTKRAHLVSQLSQSAYMPLQTPYCLIGLGRTNNYVEEMFAGVSRRQEQNYLFYEGVIPNSQLIFIPYQPSDVHDTSTWKVELYVQPGDYVPWVLASLIGAACILGVVVGVLYWMEKREDEQERRKALHIINFDAL